MKEETTATTTTQIEDMDDNVDAVAMAANHLASIVRCVVQFQIELNIHNVSAAATRQAQAARTLSLPLDRLDDQHAMPCQIN